MRRLVLAIFIYVLSASPTAFAEQVRFTIGTAAVSVDVGSYYCALRPTEHEYDRVFLRVMEQSIGENALMAHIVPCEELELARRGALDTFSTWIMFQSAMQNGQIAPIPVPSNQFLDEIEQILIAGTAVADVDDVEDGINSAIEREAGKGASTFELEGSGQPQYIGRDPNGIYSYLLQRVSTRGYSEMIVGVIGMTVVDRYMMQAIKYSEFDGDESVRTLDRDVRELLRAAHASN